MPPPQPTLPIPFGNGNGPGPASGPPFPPSNNYQAQGRAPSPPRARSPPPARRGRPSRSPSFTQGQPGNKRYRPSPSYNPPPPRDEGRDRPVNRYPSGSGAGGPPPPPPFIPPPRTSLPPRASPIPPPQGEPSGLAPALPWFIAQLPSNRSFDGTSSAFCVKSQKG